VGESCGNAHAGLDAHTSGVEFSRNFEFATATIGECCLPLLAAACKFKKDQECWGNRFDY
jgi:hypothetical protein